MPAPGFVLSARGLWLFLARNSSSLCPTTRGRCSVAQIAIDPAAPTLPFRDAAVLVELRETTTDDDGNEQVNWVVRDDLHFDALEINCGSVGASEGSSGREYGEVYEAGDAPVLTTVSSEDLRGRWVRVRLVPRASTISGDEAAAPQVIFQGFILKDQAAPDNAPAGTTPRGRQTYVVAGPERLLDMVQWSTSFWRDDATPVNPPVELGSLPPAVNRATRDGYNPHGLAAWGNRCATEPDGLPCFGGRERWNNLQWLRYVIYRHVQQYDDNDQPVWPVWTIGGQTEEAEKIEQVIQLRDRETARRQVDAALSPRLALDYVILPTDDGYELKIFTLVTETAAAGGQIVEPNPARWALLIQDADQHTVHAQFENCEAQMYDAVEVIGGRIVVCFSASGTGILPLLFATIEQGWSAALEAAYTSVGAGGYEDDDAKSAADAARGDDRFRDVWTRFEVTPRVGIQAGLAMLDAAGELVVDTVFDNLVPGQQWRKATLDWLPLRDGYDYTTDPPTYTGTGGPPSFKPPFAVVRPDRDADRWHMADALGGATLRGADGTTPFKGCTISVPRNVWGLRVKADPPHTAALGHWPGGAGPTHWVPRDGSGADAGQGGWDWQQDMLLTIAVEADHRLRLRAELPDAERRGWGLTKVVQAPDAELHVVLPGTLVDVADGARQYSPAAGPLVLRDDRPELQRLLAGLVGRYLTVRRRAVVTYEYLHAGQNNIGSVLTAVVVDGEPREVNAPITGVRWNMNERRTILATGQATR
jgi:hypothetical protein